jgi:hypothetical protein
MYQNLTKEEVLGMSRESLIEVLEWNDPHGIYSDEDSKSEGLLPITRQEAIEIICRQFEFEV